MLALGEGRVAIRYGGRGRAERPGRRGQSNMRRRHLCEGQTTKCANPRDRQELEAFWSACPAIDQKFYQITRLDVIAPEIPHRSDGACLIRLPFRPSTICSWNCDRAHLLTSRYCRFRHPTPVHRQPLQTVLPGIPGSDRAARPSGHHGRFPCPSRLAPQRSVSSVNLRVDRDI